MVVSQCPFYQPTALPDRDEHSDEAGVKSERLIAEHFAECPGMDVSGEESDVSEYELEALSDELNHTMRLTRNDFLGATMQSGFVMSQSKIDEMVSKILGEKVEPEQMDSFAEPAEGIQELKTHGPISNQADSVPNRHHLLTAVPDQSIQDNLTVDILVLLFYLVVALPIMFIEALTKGSKFFNSLGGSLF